MINRLQSLRVAAAIMVPALITALTACSRDAENLETNAPLSPPTSSQILTATDANGQPLAAAMVSMQIDPRRRVTRFTNADGQLDLNTLDSFDSTLTVRHPGLAERTAQITGGDQTLSLEPDPDFLKVLPSSEWLDLLPEGEMKREFIVNCGTCHEVSYGRITIDGRARNEAEWLSAIAMMRAMDAYEVIPPDFDDARYAAWLAENLSTDRIKGLKPAQQQNPEMLAQVEITEFALPHNDSLPHDLVTGPDGRIWITAFFYDQIWALNPENGDIEVFPVDDRETVNAQPRALEFDSEGILWIVNGGTESVLRFEPESGQYTEIPVGMYAHSIDIDPAGNIWVNDYFAAKERIARVNAATQAVTVFQVPPANRPDSEGLPLPYGLQVDNRGRLYSTQLTAGTLVSYDTTTGEGKLFEMPVTNAGPRRPGLDSRQRLWIPEFNTGFLSAFNPADESFDRIKLGISTLGIYDVEINQINDDIWATGSLASSLIRYRTDTGEIMHVPLPTEPAYTRHIAIDRATGDVWTAYSSLPAAAPRVARIRLLE